MGTCFVRDESLPRQHPVRVVGPNLFRVQNCDLPFERLDGLPRGGGISLVNQSGAQDRDLPMAVDPARRAQRGTAARRAPKWPVHQAAPARSGHRTSRQDGRRGALHRGIDPPVVLPH